MPIAVQHGASPGVYALGGFAGGQGQQRNKMEEEFLRFLEEQHARTATFQHQDTMQGNQFSHEDTTLGRRFQHDADMQGAGFAHDTDMANLGFNNRLSLMDQELADQKGLYEFKIDAEDRARANRYSNALGWVDSTDTLDEEEKQWARREIGLQLAGIKARPKLKKEVVSPEQWFKEGTYTDTNGTVYTRGKDGTIKKLFESRSGEPTNQDRLKAFQAAYDALTIERDGRKILPDIEKVRRLAEEMLQLGSHTGQGGQGSSPAIPSSVPAPPQPYDAPAYDSLPKGMPPPNFNSPAMMSLPAEERNVMIRNYGEAGKKADDAANAAKEAARQASDLQGQVELLRTQAKVARRAVEHPEDVIGENRRAEGDDINAFFDGARSGIAASKKEKEAKELEKQARAAERKATILAHNYTVAQQQLAGFVEYLKSKGAR